MKSGEEVDFIWIHNQNAFPIAVKKKCDAGNIPSGIKAFIKRYPKTTKAFVVNGNYEGKTSIDNIEIIYTSWVHAAKIPEWIDASL